MSKVVKAISKPFKKIFKESKRVVGNLASGKYIGDPLGTDVPDMPDVPSLEDTGGASDRARIAAMKRSRGGTLLTGGLGDDEDAPVNKKTLLGG